VQEFRKNDKYPPTNIGQNELDSVWNEIQPGWVSRK
jgi:hypothetical protein